MGTLHCPIICRYTVCSKKTEASKLLFDNLQMRESIFRSGIWGQRSKSRAINRLTSVFPQPFQRSVGSIHCTFSSSSNGNGSMAGNSSENDEDFVNSSVIEAVEVKSSSDGFLIKMRDGRNLRCVHNNPQGENLADYSPHPAIVLKMEDGSDLLLPIIVLEMPSILLMAAIRNVQIARPTIYQVVREMIEKMGYQVQLVRVTKRVHEAYFAQLFLKKVGNEKECIIFDLRPSDAINMAVRCKFSESKQVPIQVNRQLAYSDGVRVVEPGKVVQASISDGLLFAELDRPDGHPCMESMEFDLVRNMLIAAVEERYRDAESWPLKEKHKSRLSVIEMRILKDRMRNEYIRDKVGVAPVADKIRDSRLRWFGHIKRQTSDDPVRRVDVFDPTYIKKGRCRLKKI